MKKSSVIFESVQLGSFLMSDQEFKQYMNLVQTFLFKIYSDKVSIGRLQFVGRQSFDHQGRYKSIINYANTNINLLTSIVRDFSIQSCKELFDFLKSDYIKIFSPDGSYFSNTLDILKKTEESGDQNEQLASVYMSFVIKQKTGQDIQVQRTVKDSIDDIIDGVDLYFTLDGKKYTCQVKPLQYARVRVNNFDQPSEYMVVSSGRIKEYKVDYFIFVNKRTQKFIVFKNRNATIHENTVTFPKSSFVFRN